MPTLLLLARTRRIASYALALLLPACIPYKFGGHYYPTAAADPARHHGSLCGGSAGPHEVIELRGPRSARLYARLRLRASRYGDSTLTLDVGLHVPGGVPLMLSSPEFGLSRVEASGSQTVERRLRPTIARIVIPGRRVPRGDAGLASSHVLPQVEFGTTWEFEPGAGAMVWTTFDLGNGATPPSAVRLRVPSMTVGDSTWAPSPVTFTLRSHQWMISANC